MPNRILKTTTHALLLALAYFLTGRLGLMMPAFGSLITLIWLPTGIAVAGLLRCGYGCWPGVAIGAFAVNFTVGMPVPAALGVTVGNTLGPLLAAWALQRMGIHRSFDRKRDIVFLATAGTAGMLVSASLGVTTLSLAGLLPDGRMIAWLTWWGGDTLGVIAAAPLVLAWTRQEWRSIVVRRAEFLTWAVATVFALWGVFVLNQGAKGQPWALAFVALPMVAWAALRFGATGSSLALIVVSVGAAYGTSIGRGPFHRQEPIEGVLVLWVFMATGAVLGWLITALHVARVQATGIQRLFEKALGDVSLGVLLSDLDRRTTYVNVGFTRLTGYTEAELMGRSCSILQGPETDPAMAEKLKSALRGEGFFDGQILNYRKDGTTFWNALLISPVRNEHGEMTGFLGIQRDITKRKNAEAALLLSEEHLRTIVELEPECVKLVSPDGRLLEMNPAGLAMIEADSLDEVRGSLIADIIVPEDRAAFAAASERVLRGETGRCEFAIIGRKGTRRWLETHAVPYRNARREVIGMLGITRDITQRKEAAVQLERSFSTLQLLVNSVPAYVAFVDAEGRYRLVNRRYEEYYGLPADRIIGQSLRDMQPEASYSEMEPHIREALAGRQVRYQSDFLGPDGKSHRFDVQYFPRRGGDGVVSGFFVLVFDITESKQAEIALRDSRSRLDSILNSMEDVVWSSTPDGQKLNFVSASAQAMYGWPASEFMADPMKWLALIHPEDREVAERAFHKVSESGDFDAEYRIIRADGAVRWVHDRGRLVKDDRGQSLRLDGIVTDVTESRMAGEALRRSEEQFRTLADNMPDVVTRFDRSRRHLYINPAVESATGVKPEAFIGRTNEELGMPAENTAVWEATLGRVFSTGCDERLEFSYPGPAGKRFWESHVVAERGTDEDVESALVITRDITERKRAEARSIGELAVFEVLASGSPLSEVLTRVARNYEEAFPGAKCSVLLLDADGKHLRHGAAPSLSAAFCRAFDGMEVGPDAGLFGAAAQTRQMTVVADIATDPLWRNHRDLALGQGFRACCSVPVLSSQSRVLGTFVVYFPEPRAARPDEVAAIERGAHFASLAIERHQLIRSLQDSQVRLETLVSHLPGMAYRCQSDAHWTMTYVSDGCEAVTGYRRDELEGNRGVTYGDLVHPADRDWLWAKCQASLDLRVPCHNEYRILDRLGRERWISERASGVYDADGRLLCIDGFIQDITATRQAKIERESLDRKMQETQKLESLGVLAGGIAHDFNNLLTGILGNASVAGQSLAPNSAARAHLDQISQASLRAADLCKQMLAYSGRGRFVIQNLDLGTVVEETAQMLQISISKKAALQFHLRKGLPPVEADATQMRQVVMNLVINASEAIGDSSGIIKITTGLERLDRAYLAGTMGAPELPEGEYVFLEVADNGCGMSEETQARIFDPFFTTKFTGRGLGLAAVLGIVRGHRGAMKVTSEPGLGTKFRLLFPAASGPGEAALAVPSAPSEWRGQGTVLVVDDDVTIRLLLGQILTGMGLEPVLVADGLEALEVFSAEPGRFTLVMLDLTMPRMDGEETFTELRRLRADVPVVLMSGFNRQEAVGRFAGKGLASFLQKPFALDGLRAVLSDVLG